MQIRPVHRLEIQTLRDLAFKTFSTAFRAQNEPADFDAYMHKAFSLEQVAKELDNPESHFYFIEKDGQTIGYLKLNKGAAQTDTKLENALEIERIYVLADFQGQGVGHKLFDFALDFAQKGAFYWLWLGVWEKNPAAVRFYERHGLEVFDSHTFWMGDDAQTDVLMRRAL